MAALQGAPVINNPTTTYIFFSECSTLWGELSIAEKDLCIAQNPLQRQIGGRYNAWPPAGELLKQWNDRGYDEYAAVLKRRNEEKANRLLFSKKKLVARPLLFLLSESANRLEAVPYILISSKDKDAIREAKSHFEKHSRLCKFGIQYMADLSELRFTARDEQADLQPGDPVHGRGHQNNGPLLQGPGSTMASTQESSSVHNGEVAYPTVSGLSGARIRVVKHSTGRSNESSARLATIGGVCVIDGSYYVLTAAHIFFDEFSATASWADSGLYANSGISSAFYSQDRPPKVTGTFSISIEPNASLQRDHAGRATITEFEPISISLQYGRYATTSAGNRKVILDFDLDWALIEVQEQKHWIPTQLHASSSDVHFLSIPSDRGPPPPGPLLLATGLSGTVKADAMGSIAGLVLPWRREEIKVGLLECSIAVGDCGSIAISPESGVVYGVVIAHDPEMLLTYLVPIRAIIDRIVSILPHAADWPRFFLTSFVDVPDTGQPLEDHPHTVAIGTLANSASQEGQEDSPETTEAHFADVVRFYTLKNPDGLQYVRVESLIQWLDQFDVSGETNLELLLDNAFSESAINPVDANSLRRGPQACIIIFCILLEVGQGRLIDTIVRLGITDSALPLTKTQLADVSLPDELVTSFLSAQWAYRPVILSLNMGVILSDKQVIPIHTQRLISSGGTAQVFEIVVLEEFVADSLRQTCQRSKVEVAGLGKGYQFAIKQFGTDAFQIFESELSALSAFRENRFLNRALGHFAQRMKGIVATPAWRYSILLEYLDYNLEDKFQHRQPPILKTDIEDFWTAMSGIAEAVSAIHTFSKRKGGRRDVFHGWHADIKPANILILSDTLTSRSHFKLADLGFARFEKSDTDMTRIYGGTRLYAAPEVFDAPDIRTLLGRSIDIWSLGCVFSLAATWLVLGPDGVSQFQLLRERAHEEIFTGDADNFEIPPGAFHDGKQLLEVVYEWHQLLRAAARSNDRVTSKVLDLIEAKLLTSESDRRMNAASVHESMRGMLREAADCPNEVISLKVAQALKSSSLSRVASQPRDRPDSASSALHGNQILRRRTDPAELVAEDRLSPRGAPSETLETYRYQPLKSNNSIRLVTLLPAGYERDEIICRLHEVDLSEADQQYEAVSWLWGSDSTRSKIKIQATSGIFVLNGPSNLVAALRNLRLQHKARVLWINALCINQDDILEKSEQINMIPAIFGMAQQVPIWLGEPDQDSDLALDFIQQEVLRLQSFDELCEDPAAAPKWRALHNFMGRAWFQRRWVIQEVALARSAILVCGSKALLWTDFATAVELFVEVESATHRLSEVMKRSSAANYSPGWFENVPALGASLLVEATSSLFQISDKKSTPIHTLEYLVSSLTIFKCADPRDVVYALLSIAKDVGLKPARPDIDRSAVSGNQHAPLSAYPVDYNLSLIKVCKQFVEFAILRCKENDPSRALDILCRPWAPKINDWRSRGLPQRNGALPSWVASISDAPFQLVEFPGAGDRMIRTNADALAGLPLPKQAIYNAAGNIRAPANTPRFRQRARDQYSLYVEGHVVDFVDTVTVSSQNGMIPEEWLETVGLASRESEVTEEFWRTLVADRDRNGRVPPAYFGRACREILKRGPISGALDTTRVIQEGGNSIISQFLRRVQAVIWNRCLIRTSYHQRLGIVRKDVREGDKICILYGCSVPVILREHRLPRDLPLAEQDSWEGEEEVWHQLVGECYVNGMMDGEAIGLRGPSANYYAGFEIR